ncbi:MAG: hypothetical protein TU35_009915 [Thermoproteus sp. AZ2]|uniref:Uncharacterized protein n=1 Tax=Thermoproteus sp. AZ2 TaxID=1609232 RepID=A0ACC6V3C8_9CREN
MINEPNRYLVIRARDPLKCLEDVASLYLAPLGLHALYLPLNVVGVYDDVLIIGVPRRLVPKARALIALLNDCHTVKVRGTIKAARRTAMSMRRARI